MPKVAYSEEDRERIRTQLVAVGLELMAKQGIQHTTVEQIYQAVGISRTFFYSFFPTKEDLIVESQKWMAGQYKAEVEQWGYIDPARWNAFYNWLNENDLVAVDIPEGTGFSNDYLPQ